MITKTSKILLILIIGVALLLIVSCQSETETASPLSAKLSELEGLVEMKQVGEQDFVQAQPDSVLGVDGQVQTGDDGKVRLDLTSGTIIRVAPSSLFTLVSNEPVEGGLATRLKLELGRIFVSLNGGSMDIDTPSGVASVRGSNIMVEITQSPENPDVVVVTVTCLEGQCGGENGDGTQSFTDGQKIVLSFDTSTGEVSISDVLQMTQEDFDKWWEANPDLRDLIEQIMALVLEPEPTEPPPDEPPADDPPADEPSEPPAPTCFSLLEPDDGAEFYMRGGVDFSWEPQEGAVEYLLTFTYPSGIVVVFDTTETSLTRYIESMPAGGNYSFEVTALDENGDPICTTESSSFTKAETEKRKVEPEETCDPCDYYGDCYDPFNPLCDQ